MKKKILKFIITFTIFAMLFTSLGYFLALRTLPPPRKVEEEIKEEEIKGEIKEIKKEEKDLKIPKGENLISFLEEDTNQDGEKETIVVTYNEEKKKSRIYILDSKGNKVFERESLVVPERVELRKFSEDEYKSFYLVFPEGGYFIRWSDRKYVIPEEERGF